MTPRALLHDLCFGEGPRWHDDRLWFSDMHDHRVLAVDLEGRQETICEVPNQPSGLGWRPDGSLLVVSMRDRRLLCWNGERLDPFAELSQHAPFHCNDMVVDRAGRAYVGNFGFDLYAGETPRPTDLLRVDPDGTVQVAAEDLRFPNGTVITPDGRTLIIGESFGPCLTAFDVADDGSLSNRREWASMEGAVPDGICLDAEGAIWVASPVSHKVLRMREGGEVLQRIPVETQAFACMLGGPERRHLFICTALDSHPEKCRDTRSGRIEVVEVDVPGAGLP